MAVPTIVVYSYSENQNIIRLLNAGEPVNLAGVTKIDLVLDHGSRTISSSDHPYDITWSEKGDPSERGEVYLQIGRLFFYTLDYLASVMVFDDLNPKGIFWGLLRIRAIEGRIDHPIDV